MPLRSILEAHPKMIFFTDFDGTITLKDTNDFMTDNYGFGHALRRQGNRAVLDGTDNFRDGFQKMLDSWKTSFPETTEILKRSIKLDPGFATFMTWARAHSVPVVVVSSGLEPVIRALLAQALPAQDNDAIEIIANGVQLRAPLNDLNKPGGWTIDYRDPDSPFGHDKSRSIRPYADAIAKIPAGHPRPTLLYAGDGVSDLSAARETDLLFAKAGHDLIIYCERENIPFTVFDDWAGILEKTKEIYDGTTDVKTVAHETLQRVRTNSL